MKKCFRNTDVLMELYNLKILLNVCKHHLVTTIAIKIQLYSGKRNRANHVT